MKILEVISTNTQDNDIPYLITIMNTPWKKRKRYLITNLMDWCVKHGVSYNSALVAIKNNTTVRGSANLNSYRISIYIDRSKN